MQRGGVRTSSFVDTILRHQQRLSDSTAVNVEANAHHIERCGVEDVVVAGQMHVWYFR